MSTQTLAFFENKTDEQIIDWMLTNLSEEQIKMCLNTSGIPDTSGLTQIPTPPVPDQPVLPQPVLPQPTPVVAPRPTQRQDVKTKILNNFRTKCPSNVIIVEKLEGRIVYFYQFKEVSDEDIRLNSQLSQYVGTYRWVFRTIDRDNMPSLCQAAKLEANDDIEENREAYYQPPQIVEEIARNYLAYDLPYPLPFGGPTAEPLISQDVNPIIYDSRIQAARNTQINSQQKINEQMYPKIFKRGIRTFPIIIYKIEGEMLHYYVLIIRDGKISLMNKNTPVGEGYNTIFRREAKNLENSIDSNIPDTINLIEVASGLVDTLPENEKDAIKQVYTLTDTNMFSFFGNDYDGLDGETLDTLDETVTSVEELDINDQPEPVLLNASEADESFYKVGDEMECGECMSDDDLKIYKGRISDLHCARCIERRDLILKGPKSLSHTHHAVVTKRVGRDDKKTVTVQWHPNKTDGSSEIDLPSGFGEDLLLF